MKIRNLRIGDASEIYDLFSSAQVSRESERTSGFCEYDLTEEEIRERLKLSKLAGLGLGLIRDNNRIAGYLIGYPTGFGKELDDNILTSVNAPQDTIYVDQFYMAHGLGVHNAGRLGDLFMHLARDRTQTGVICAIPQLPWRNVASTRIAMANGYKRVGNVAEGDLSLGIFAKPFWNFGEVSRSFPIEIAGGKR